MRRQESMRIEKWSATRSTILSSCVSGITKHASIRLHHSKAPYKENVPHAQANRAVHCQSHDSSARLIRLLITPPRVHSSYCASHSALQKIRCSPRTFLTVACDCGTNVAHVEHGSNSSNVGGSLAPGAGRRFREPPNKPLSIWYTARTIIK